MKTNFYLRLFFAFLLFSFIITAVNYYFSSSTKISLKEENDRDILFNNIDLKTKVIAKSIQLIENKIDIIKQIKNFKNVKKVDFNDENILEINYFNLNDRTNLLKKRDYYLELIKQPLQEFTLKKVVDNDKIYLVKKDNNEILEIVYDISNLFKTRALYTIYNVFDKNGNYLFDIGNTKNLNSINFNKNLKDIYPKNYKTIKNTNNYFSSKFASKIIKIDDYLEYIIVSQSKKYNLDAKLSLHLDKGFIYTIFIVIIVSFILAMVFSNPASSFKLKLVSLKDQNDKKVAEVEELNRNLDFIDKNIMILTTNINGEITDVSSALCNFTKYTKNELIGQSYKILLNNVLGKNFFENLWKQVQSQKLNNLEIKGIKKDGDIFWFNSVIEPIRNDFDEVIGFEFISENITQKKKVEEIYKDLDFQLSQYNAIFNNVNNGIAIMDLAGRFKKFNESFCDLFKYSYQDLSENITFKDLINEDENKVNDLLIEIKDLRKISNIEKVFSDSAKNKIHLEMTLSIMPDNKSIVLIVSSLKDKRKQQEINQLLEKKIKEELEKSRQKDEIHKQEQIKNAKLTSIGSLAAGITHEINTPLTYIKGSFELMGYDIEDLPDSDIKTRMIEDKQKIEDGLARIANIVESMREISQKTKETKEPTNIYSTLITVLTMAYNRSKQVAPIYLKDDLFEIGELDKNKYEYITNVQKQRIEQVWIIIINNALDELIKIDSYSNRSLNINIYIEDKEIVVKFEDNAGGIDEEILPNIFDPFISNKEHSGMGVGLNVAKNIVEQQGGSIKAFNNKNGAIFEVRLTIV